MIKRIIEGIIILGATFYVIYLLAVHSIYALGAKSTLFFTYEGLLSYTTKSGWLAHLFNDITLQFTAHYFVYSVICTLLVLTESALIQCTLKQISDIRGNGTVPFGFSLFPAAILLAFSVSPNFSLTPVFGIIVAILGFFLELKINPKNNIILIFLFSILVYYLVGYWTILYIILTLIVRPSIRTSTILFCGIILLPLIESYFTIMPWDYYYIPFFTRENLSILLVTILIFLLSMVKTRTFGIPFIVITALSIFIFIKDYNPREKIFLNIERCMNEQRWNDLITVSSKYPNSNILITYAVNLSLLKSGKLASHVLDYPQRFGVEGLFIGPKAGEMRNAFSHHFYASLGLYNEAHRLIWESSSSIGFNRINLSYLYFYNKKIGRDKVAYKFKRHLDKTFFGHEYLKAIQIDSYPESIIIPNKSAHFTNMFNISRDLIHLSKCNAHNKQSAEVLLVSLLLSNRLLEFAEHTHLIDFFYSHEIPLIYDHALALLKNAMDPKQFKEIGIRPSAKAISDYEEYGKAYQAASGNVKLLDKYKNTLFYYINFISPYGSKVIVQ